MKKYAVNVTLFVEAKETASPEAIAESIVNFGGIDDERLLGWDLEEIKECLDESPSV